MLRLPNEVISEIFTYLPAKDIIKSSEINKRVKNITTDENFRKYYSSVHHYRHDKTWILGLLKANKINTQSTKGKNTRSPK